MLFENNWFISWSIGEESTYQTCESRVDSLVDCKQSRLRRKFGGRAGKKDRVRKYSPLFFSLSLLYSSYQLHLLALSKFSPKWACQQANSFLIIPPASCYKLSLLSKHFSLPSILLLSQAMKLVTQKHTKRIEIHQWEITKINMTLWSRWSNFVFLRGNHRWLTAAKKAKVSWLLNFRVHVFLKSTVVQRVTNINIYSLQYQYIIKRKVMRINKLITKGKIPWSFTKFSQLIL